MTRDIRFVRENFWFNYKAGVVIIEDGCVLVAKNEEVSYFYPVGGAVHLGETAENAALREAFEETGIKYEIDRLAFVHENFFKGDWGGAQDKDCHEIALYFLMKPKGIKKFNHDSITAGNIKETMVWLPIDKLGEYEVYPTFFKDKLKNLEGSIQHIVRIDSEE